MEGTKKCAKMKTHNFDRFWLVYIAQKAWPGENFYIQINLRCRAIHPKVEIEIVTWSRHVSEVFFEPCWRSKIAKIPKKCQNFAKFLDFHEGHKFAILMDRNAWLSEYFYIYMNLRHRAIQHKVEIETDTWFRHALGTYFECYVQVKRGDLKITLELSH